MKLSPYLLFQGNAKEAIDYYATIFGAKYEMMTYGESPEKCDEDWKDKILHCRMKFENEVILLSDGFKGYESKLDASVQLCLELDSVEKINEVFEKMSEGGKVKMPLNDMFWGAKFGMLTDKFGVNWMFSPADKKAE